jgi:NitT/TauT family transport system ATP-binding protein
VTAPTQSGADEAGPVLALRDVAMTWPDGTEAVARFDLELHRGELVSLVGPSGCGKSTVLRIAAGLEQATSGEVVGPRSTPGCVFQDANLLPWRDVAGNVELFLELDRVPAASRRSAVDDALRLVGLDEFSHHLPHQVSGGMQMRTALARALVTRPDVLLFDEPFAALDELLRERMQEELLRLFDDQGFAGMFITHSVHEAVYLSGRVVVMTPRPGTIAERVDVPFPYPRPAELRFDAEFVAITQRISRAMRAVRASEGQAP